MSDTATVHIDGAARGNPGPAAYALVLRRPGLPDVEESDTLGKATNNVAEYTGLIRGLERAIELGVKNLTVFSDSELIVKQMNGEYRVKNADLQELYAEAQALRKKLSRVTLTHVRRAQNADADRLCNEALDGRPRRWAGVSEPRSMGEAEKRSPTPVPIPAPAPVLPVSGAPARVTAPPALRADALAILEAAAEAWAANGPKSPTPDDVWNSLWKLIAKPIHSPEPPAGREVRAGGPPAEAPPPW